jgi:hypothetical protein
VLPASSSLDNALKNLKIWEVVICPVRIPEGQKIDDVIRIYELEPH